MNERRLTGFKDAIGQEIREGDICRLDGDVSDEYDTGYVNWDSFVNEWIFSNSYMNDSLSVYANRLKILGNIFENLELLPFKPALEDLKSKYDVEHYPLPDGLIQEDELFITKEESK